MLKRFLRQSAVLALLALVSTSCVNRNITYVQVPTASQMVTDRTQDGEPLTARIIISGTTEIVPSQSNNPDPKVIKTPAVTPPDEAGPRKGFCPLYRLPALPLPPAAPLAQLNALKPTDIAQIDALTRNHIIELHQYIATSQAELARSYKQYLANCERLQHRPVKKTG